MKTRKVFYRVLTVVILCAMVLPWSSGSLSGTAHAACPVTAENWHEVGADSACAGGISNNSSNPKYPSLAITPDGVPYIVWEDDGDGDDEIYVRRWNGSSWGEVGASSASGGGISNNSGSSRVPELAIAPNGTPYVAWQDDNDGDREIYVRRWNGSSWEQVGTGSATGGGISNNSYDSYGPSVAVAPDGTPYVAWADDSDGDYEIYVKRWNGSSWEQVGTGSATGGGISNNSGYSRSPSVAVAPNGTPYVAWRDDSGGNFEIYVRRWNGSSWEEVGTGSASGGGISNIGAAQWDPSVAITPNGTPYVAWDGAGGTHARRWNESSWEQVETGLVSGGDSLAIAPDGMPYIAGYGRDEDWEIYAQRWNGSSWVEVGTGSASGGGISDNSGESMSPSLAVAPDGTPYVAWDDSSGGDREIYVRRWGGNSIVTEARADIGMPYNTYRGCPSPYTGCGGPYHGFYYGVCTDLAMDAYHAGVPFSLQNALYQDHRAHPGRYRYGTARHAEDLRRYFTHNQQLPSHNQVYQPGDIAFFDWTGNGLTNHVNVISEVDANGRPLKMVDATGVYQYNPSGRAFEHSWSGYYDQHIQGHGRLGTGSLAASASETLQVLQITVDSPSVTLSLRDANGKSVSSSYDENLVAINNEASIPYIPGGTYADVGTERVVTVTQPLSNTAQYFAELTGEETVTYHLHIETLQDSSVTDSEVFTQAITAGDTHGSTITLSAPGGTIEFAATSPGPSPKTDIPDSLELAGLVGTSAQATFTVAEVSGRQPLENVAISATNLMDQLGGTVSGSLLTITPDSFSVPADGSQNVNVQVSLAGVSPGVYQGGLVITSDSGSTHMMQLALEVQFHQVYLPITLKNH